jgi:acetylornithine/N-succinyldiaminopimelate aminotransferase
MNNNAQKPSPEFLDEAKKSILFTTNRPDIVMERGQGMYLWDTTGKAYLDFVGGWAVTSLGHSPDVIADSLIKQSRILVNASPAYYNIPMLKFAKLLTDISCFDRVFFASSGAEANESAIKLARKYGSLYKGGAYEIITTINSFHGRTLATMSATGKKKWEPLFEPKVPGFIHIPLNDTVALQAAITEKTCAIMLEPVQGEGGVYAATDEYMKLLRQICTEKNILLIVDEVQTGLGRTGKMFAYEHYGIEPDVMTLAKGIGGGFPLSAMLAKEKFNVFEAGDQGGTYSGQPLATEVGYAVVNEIINKNLSENAARQGTYLTEKLQEISARFGLSNIRGRGLLLAVDLPSEKGGEIVAQCMQDGLLINSPQPSTVRLIPPLIVTNSDIDAMLKILSAVLVRVL